jgi:hypothetical protein
VALGLGAVESPGAVRSALAPSSLRPARQDTDPMARPTPRPARGAQGERRERPRGGAWRAQVMQQLKDEYKVNVAAKKNLIRHYVDVYVAHHPEPCA